MKAYLACWLIVGVAWSSGLSWANEPETPAAIPGSASPATTSLEQRFESLERVDEELAEAKRMLETSTDRAARRKLRARIQELEAQQEALLQELEELFGPLPPAVRYEPPIDLEEQLESQRRHHDAILERDVEQRLPSD